MTLKPRTRHHLERAARNREVARTLIHPAQELGLNPPPREWAVVAAFYSAVHYVNAFIWERQEVEPTDHRMRNDVVASAVELRTTRGAYLRLRTLGQDARYLPQFEPRRADIETALHTDLEVVRRGVLLALGQPL